MGKTVIMGRKTYESIGHPLPGRFNIIISSINNYFADNCITVPTLEAALANTKSQEVFICGGCSVYKEALPVADRIYLTEIDAEFFGDVFFQILRTFYLRLRRGFGNDRMRTGCGSQLSVCYSAEHIV